MFCDFDIIMSYACFNPLYCNYIIIDSSAWFDTIQLGYSIVNIWECKVKILIMSDDLFYLYKQCRSYAAFHLDLLCLQKYSFRFFSNTDG